MSVLQVLPSGASQKVPEYPSLQGPEIRTKARLEPLRFPQNPRSSQRASRASGPHGLHPAFAVPLMPPSTSQQSFPGRRRPVPEGALGMVSKIVTEEGTLRTVPKTPNHRKKRREGEESSGQLSLGGGGAKRAERERERGIRCSQLPCGLDAGSFLAIWPRTSTSSSSSRSLASNRFP